MREELNKILSMLEEGRLTKDQASRLIETLQGEEENPQETTKTKKTSRKFKINIIDDKQRNFNLTLPVSWVSFGLRFVSDPHQFFTVGGKSIPVDKKILDEAISNPEFRGTLVNIEDEGTHIEMLVE